MIRPRLPLRRGVTLLEVLVASLLLSVGLLAALEVVAFNTVTTQKIRDRERALMFARSKMDEILKEPVLSVGTDEGKGVDETTDYDWEVVVEQDPALPLYRIQVVVRNRNETNEPVMITALRRPDIQSEPENGNFGTGPSQPEEDTTGTSTGGSAT